MWLWTLMNICTFLSVNAIWDFQTDFTNHRVKDIHDAFALKQFLNKYTQEFNGKHTPVRIDDVIAKLGPITGVKDSLVNATAVSMMETKLQVASYRYDVSSQCLNHTKIFLESLLSGNAPWPLQMIDAMGKPGSNILGLNTYWTGAYEECLNVKRGKPVVVNQTAAPFDGMYCRSIFTIKQLSNLGRQAALAIGTCFPDSCSDYDATVLTNLTVSLLPIDATSSFAFTFCERDLEYSSKAKAVTVVCSIFLAIMVAATVYDIVIVRKMLSCLYTNKEDHEMTGNNYGSFNGSTVNTPLISDRNETTEQNGKLKRDTIIDGERKQKNADNKTGLGGKILLSFSVYSNSLKILNTTQPAGALTAVNGIRFISMTWVILGHTYVFGLNYTDNLASYLPEILSRFTFQAIANATVAVDTFFVLSGLLVSYLSLKEMKRCGGAAKFKWGMYYFHRFWRLTPPYMLFLMFYVPLFKYWSKGPFWPQSGIEKDECESTWWHNLLYINNFYKEQCMGWSWYLANDMQFYVISPLFLIPLYYSPILGTLVCFAFIIVNFLSSGIIAARDNLTTSVLLQGNTGFDDTYIKPWCRVGPYVVGFITGYILYKYECKIRIPKMLNVLGWLLATVTAILVLYGLYTSDGQAKDLGKFGNALYNATSRTAWGMAVAWVVFACATGYGGPVNTLLSWRAIIPLSRLTYCAYLVHPVVMDVAYLSRRTTLHLYDIMMVYYFLGHLCLSYAAAFIVSLAFESPMMGLEKAILGRGKNG